MTTLDALILLVLALAILALGWGQYREARRYGSMRIKAPQRPPEAKNDVVSSDRSDREVLTHE